jgi:hypothetical protein
MNSWLLFLIGAATGFLAGLALRLPLFHPLDPNAAAVAAALSSTVLAVAGAFWLWRHQNQRKQDAIREIMVPIFEPLYVALCQARDMGSLEGAEKLYVTVQSAMGSQMKPSREDVVSYQDRGFPRAVQGALSEARTVLSHISGIQDLALSTDPKWLPHVLAMHRIASAAVDELPDMLASSKPQYLSQMGPQVRPEDFARLNWAIGRIAIALNLFDGGSRDAAAYHELEKGRSAAIRLWNEGIQKFHTNSPETDQALPN